ncbi:heme exporter protein CcmB [Candidatus Jidaibacter acanthamoebae]|nr:heme exporter protein CcmB [Candidatus Jidaibacter acanthamoeba]
MSRIAHQMRPSDFKVFKLIFKRQWLLSVRNFNELIYPLFYFLIAVITFKIAIGAAKATLEVNIGMIFVINIFVLILTHEALISKDYKLGFLEQFYLIGAEFALIILAKYLAQLALYVLISACLIPLVLFLTGVAVEYWHIALLSQVLLSAVVLLFLLLSSAMLLGSKANALLSVIVLVFTFPGLIFATLGINNHGYLWLLGALVLFFMPIIIVVSKYLVLIALEDKG